MVMDAIRYYHTNKDGCTATAGGGPHGSDDSELSSEDHEPVICTQRHTELTNETIRRQYTNERDTVTQTGRQTDRHMDKYTCIYTHIT